MIPVIDKPEVINSNDPILRIDMRQMDPEDIQTMLEQSRDGFYSNKELAPIREYATNARDSHIRAGKPTLPIRVTLPTEMEPEFKVRDFGIGLSYETIADVYFKYWKSTKRFTNDENGCLGIGSKSAFSYTAIYTVTTWCEGMKTVITGQKSGFADVIYRQPIADGEPDGVEITIPVLQKDIEKFTLEALHLFKYWDVRPEFVNLDEATKKQYFHIMDSTPFLSGDGWSVRPAGYNSGEGRVVMGFVPYLIDWSQVKNSLSTNVSNKVRGIFEFLQSNLVVLEFPNGTLAFTPNRESLQYNEITVNAISDKIVLIYTTLLTMITSKISEASNIWEAKMIYNRIFRKELDGFDKEMFYGGNLTSVETLLRSRIQWRGITIENGLFNNLEYWDKNDGKLDQTVKYLTPLFSTYVLNEDKDGIQICRCNRRRNNKMIASPKSLVIIQDTKKARYVKAAAAYYLLNPANNISQVYVLNLVNPNVEAEFFKHYAFDSVPATRISQIEHMLKSHVGKGGRGGNSGMAQPLYCPIFKIQDRRSGTYVSEINWSKADENARNVTGGVFVVYKNVPGQGRHFELNGELHSESRYICQSIYDLCKVTDHKLTKVYGINKRTLDSVWFKKAVREGRWTHLTNVMASLIEKLDETTLKKVHTFQEYDSSRRIGTVLATKLLEVITNQESTIYKYCKSIIDIIPLMECNDAVRHFTKKFEDKEFTCKDTTKLMKSVQTQYPLLFKLENSGAISNCDFKDKSDCFSVEELREVIDYINLVDSHLTK